MQRISSEFADFVREIGVQAFDRLHTEASTIDAPLRPVLRVWSKLSHDQKHELFDELIAVVQAGESTPPESPTPQRAPLRRFDPAEVEATLPAKPSKKAAPKKKKR